MRVQHSVGMFVCGWLWLVNLVHAFQSPDAREQDPAALDRKRAYQAAWTETRQQWQDSRDVDVLNQAYAALSRDFADQPHLELDIFEHLSGIIKSVPAANSERRSSWLSTIQRHLDAVETDQRWLGGQSVELTFRSTAALRSAGQSTVEWAPEVAQRCFLTIGQVARRLRQNPSFPAQNHPAIANWMWDEARGWAIANQPQQALASLKNALELGLVDFEEVLEDELLLGLPNSGEWTALVKNSRGQYEARMRDGIGRAVRQFQSFAFRFSCTSLTNARVTESHFQGKWLVVDLWGTWCVPCRAEIPHLKRLHREYASRGWDVVGIAIEQGATEAENRKLVQEFVDQQSVPYRCLLGDSELLEQVPQQKSLPTLVFINPQGKVVFAAQGYHDYTQLKVILETLQQKSVTQNGGW